MLQSVCTAIVVLELVLNLPFMSADFDVDIEVIEDDGKREHWRFSGDNFESSQFVFRYQVRIAI